MLELQKQTTKEIQDLKKSGKGTIAFGCVSSAHMVLLEKGILPFCTRRENAARGGTLPHCRGLQA